MTTNSLTAHFGADRVSFSIALPTRKTASDKLALGVLTLVFSLSFLQFCFDRSDVVRLVPLSALLAGTTLFLLVCPREQGRVILTSVVRPITVLTIAVVSLPPLIFSLDRGSSYPVQYGLVMVVTLVTARILLSAVGLEGLLLSFFYATTISILIVVGMTFSDLITSIGSKRYSPLYFYPNRIGFFVAGSIPTQLWFAILRRKRHVLLLSTLCVFVIVAASSRGSTGALLIGAAVTVVLYVVRLIRYNSFTISRRNFVGMLALLFLLTAFAATDEPAVETIGNYVWTKMELDSHDRGLNSGFTGRANGWHILLDVVWKTSWLSGNGYRTTDEDFGFAVDNGYLSSVYEIGLFSTAIVVTKYLLVILFASILYVTKRSSLDNCLLATICTVAVFLANAFVFRVMFGCGDPVSLLALFWFVSNRQDAFPSRIFRMSYSKPRRAIGV